MNQFHDLPCNYFEIFYYYPSIYIYLQSGRFPLGFSIKTTYVLVPRMCYMPCIYTNYFRVKNYANLTLYFLRVADFFYKQDVISFLCVFVH